MIVIAYVLHGRPSRYRQPSSTVHGMTHRHFALCGTRPQRRHLVTPITDEGVPVVTCDKCRAVIKRNEVDA